MSQMTILLHGGKCCGIKHIYGLDSTPLDWEAAKSVTKAPPTESVGYFNSPLNVFADAAPEETKADRFDRYLSFIKATRPHGIVEVVLSQYQRVRWEDFLFARGFSFVVECWNSNSSNYIYIYHLVSDRPVKESKPVGAAPWQAAPVPGPVDDE